MILIVVLRVCILEPTIGTAAMMVKNNSLGNSGTNAS